MVLLNFHSSRYPAWSRFSYQAQETVIEDSFCQHLDEQVVVNGVEITGDVSFDEPPCAIPGTLHFGQRRMAAHVLGESRVTRSSNCGSK